MRIFEDLDAFRAADGERLGAGDWFQITQARIDAFADVTEDWQWIHVDSAKAARGPYGATIAHGYLTLSLIPRLGGGIFRVEGLSMAINYGVNKVRFPQPVRAGARIRAVADLVSVVDIAVGTQGVIRYTIEIDGEDKPACVAETVRVMMR
ncbi:MaoC family dehydratase [Nocardioides sp. AE5]|uniref:MaoC family dehydratase n=1 Tax=Nocardioides sp. AE5 TaxID=2962573 RepID=UPI00288133FA|nr:MaoC family dehydratase [Nocardioides sp. AE5]MDT0202696.1 MaoC family dehydratase [Nocardioides sp. AE5]